MSDAVITDIVLELARTLLLLGVLAVLWRHGGSSRVAGAYHTGWRLILAGFGLMLLGSLLDITDNFPALNSYVVIGDAETEAWLEKLIGYTGGSLLLFLGFRRWMPLVGERQQRHLRLMDAIARAQASFISNTDTRQAFDALLGDILDLTGSEYGFIGEVLHTREGQPYLKTYAITNIAWNDETRAFYAEHAPQGMEFTKLNSLFGAVLTTAEPVIANDPAHDPRRGGLPAGHPPLHAFLGVPIRLGGRMVGMVGIANRPGGYSLEEATFLGPLSGTIAQLIEARQAAQAHLAIENTIKQLSLVASKTTNGVVITDVAGRIEWVNAGFERISGYTLAEVRGRRPGEVLQGPATDPATVALIGQALGRRESCEVELVNYTKGGSPYWVNVKIDPIREDDGLLRGFMGIETDISARKADEASLAASAQHTQAVLDNVLDGIITIDGRGMVDSFNRSAERIFGYATDEVVGRNVSMLMPEPHRSGHDDYLRNYQTTGVARVIGIGREVDGQRKDGSLFPLELAVTMVTRDGQPFYIGLVRDITERKRLEQLKNEFLSTVSHELRTPLTAIHGALGLVAGGALGTLPEAVENLVGIALRNSEHLTQLVNDLLDMEKMAAGAMRFEMEVVEIMPLVEEAMEVNRAYGEARQVSFHLASRLDDALVRVDARRFMQVMANLLSNAAKFSPEGGRVEISLSRRDGFARVAVRDYGPGVPASFHDRIFNKFSQAGASDGRQQGGTGLGLAITRKLVRHMGGRIGFDSLEGAGATFHVDLPLVRPAVNHDPSATSD